MQSIYLKVPTWQGWLSVFGLGLIKTPKLGRKGLKWPNLLSLRHAISVLTNSSKRLLLASANPVKGTRLLTKQVGNGWKAPRSIRPSRPNSERALSARSTTYTKTNIFILFEDIFCYKIYLYILSIWIHKNLKIHIICSMSSSERLSIRWMVLWWLLQVLEQGRRRL